MPPPTGPNDGCCCAEDGRIFDVEPSPTSPNVPGPGPAHVVCLAFVPASGGFENEVGMCWSYSEYGVGPAGDGQPGNCIEPNSDGSTVCEHARCACCFDGICDSTPLWTLGTCNKVNGVPSCPPDYCGADSCGPTPEEHPCCQLDGSCSMEFQYTCETLLHGQWFEAAATCDDIECIPPEGCRPPRAPIQEAATKPWLTSLCETAVLGMTIRPPSHGNSGAEGMDLELVTTHEVRSVFTNKAFLDPCRLQYGYMHLDADGDIYPIFCSQPEANVSSARWARGYFSVQLDHDDPYDRVPVGDIHARVGVEPPVWAEVALFHQWMPCGVFK